MVDFLFLIINIIIKGVSYIKTLSKIKRGAKMTNTICDNVTRQLYRGKCKITSIIIDCDGVDGTVNIYDGDSTKGEKRIKCGAILDTSFSPNLGAGIYFDKGIHVVVNANTTNYTITIAGKDE